METGKELWRSELPATAMTYRAPNGKQYVVISAGGHKGATEIGDYVVAFTLP